MAEMLDEQQEPQPKRQRTGILATILWIVIGLLAATLLVVGTVLFWNAISNKDSTATQSVDTGAASEGFFEDVRSYNLGSMQVQLRPAPGETIPGTIQVTVGIGYPASNTDMEEKLSDHEAEIKNAVEEVLASFRGSQLAQPDGRQLAAAQIRASLNQFLSGDRGAEVVHKVYLTGMRVLPGRS